MNLGELDRKVYGMRKKKHNYVQKIIISRTPMCGCLYVLCLCIQFKTLLQHLVTWCRSTNAIKAVFCTMKNSHGLDFLVAPISLFLRKHTCSKITFLSKLRVWYTLSIDQLKTTNIVLFEYGILFRAHSISNVGNSFDRMPNIIVQCIV